MVFLTLVGGEILKEYYCASHFNSGCSVKIYRREFLNLYCALNYKVIKETNFCLLIKLQKTNINDALSNKTFVINVISDILFGYVTYKEKMFYKPLPVPLTMSLHTITTVDSLN